jgi:serine/threonine protein phosphatase PrpC
MQIAREAHVVIRLTAISAEEEPHSTVAAFLINAGGDCHWAHAGDSRVYHFHGGKLVRKTVDHSYVQMLVKRGEITEEQANVHPQSNILMACLGTETDPPVDMHFIPKLARRRLPAGMQRRHLALLHGRGDGRRAGNRCRRAKPPNS